MPFLREYLQVRKDRNRGVVVPPAAPLNLRASARVRLEEAPFLLLPDDTLVQFPGENLFVTDLSTPTISGVKVTRAYLRPEGTDSRAVLLQIAADGDRIVPMLFRIWDEFTPQNEQEWGSWLAEGDGIIGLPTFMIPGEGGRVPTIYNRAVQPDHDAWVAPEHFHESSSPSGAADIDFMLFYRTLGESPALRYIKAATENLSTALGMLPDNDLRASLKKVTDALQASAVEMTPSDMSQEYLLVESVQGVNICEIVLWVGIELSPIHFKTI